MNEEEALSGYRILWMQVLFDLPVTTRKARKQATEFRNFLLDHGFDMTQYSVYQRVCSGKEMVEAMMRRVETNLPDAGKVHVLIITDKQYENIQTFRGKNRGGKNKNTSQLTLF